MGTIKCTLYFNRLFDRFLSNKMTKQNGQRIQSYRIYTNRKKRDIFKWIITVQSKPISIFNCNLIHIHALEQLISIYNEIRNGMW